MNLREIWGAYSSLFTILLLLFMLRNISYSILLSLLCLVAFVSVTRSGEVIVTKKTVQEIDANGNITNKTYVTKTTKGNVGDIKGSLVATWVQNETLLFDSIQKYRKEKKNQKYTTIQF